MKTVLALTALLLPLLLGAVACDQNSGALPCVSSADRASSDTLAGVAVSTAADACVQGAASDALGTSTGTAAGVAADPSQSGVTPSATKPLRRRGQN